MKASHFCSKCNRSFKSQDSVCYRCNENTDIPKSLPGAAVVIALSYPKTTAAVLAAVALYKYGKNKLDKT